MEKTIQFSANNKSLFGILHLPDSREIHRAVLMVIGGPQTRIASHRMYVQLARFLCDYGLAVFRFDYEGMGDSHGDFVGFEYAGESIRAAIDVLYREIPSLKDLILWSLCDGASASIFYAPADRERITAMILANPYVHTEEGEAQAILKHYYIRRLFEKSFWQKVFSLQFSVKEFISSFSGLISRTVRGKKERIAGQANQNESLPNRVLHSIFMVKKPIAFLISTNDLTGLEFRDLLQNRPESKKMLAGGQLCFRYIKDADHTFSSSRSKELAFKETLSAISQFGTKRPVYEPLTNATIAE